MQANQALLVLSAAAGSTGRLSSMSWLRKLPDLAALSISNLQLPAEATAELAQLPLHQLKHLSLSGCGPQNLRMLLSAPFASRTLETLELSHGSLHSVSPLDLPLQALQCLSAFTAQYNDLTLDAAVALLAALRWQPKLEVIDLTLSLDRREKKLLAFYALHKNDTYHLYL
jgi:hypothetical protein